MLKSLGVAISEQATGQEAGEAAQPPARPRDQQQAPATVLVVGADRLFRETLKLFLESDGFAVVEGGNLDELCDRMPPDVGQTVLIYSLHGEAAIARDLACIQEARRRFPGLRTLALAATINAAIC